MFVTSFKVVIKDIQGNSLEYDNAKVVWDEGPDTSVHVEVIIPSITHLDLLDKWEREKTTVEVSIAPQRCAEMGTAGDFIDSKCTNEITDMFSQSGKATISYVLNPSGPSKIIINFVEVE